MNISYQYHIPDKKNTRFTDYSEYRTYIITANQNFLLYTAPSGDIHISVYLNDETLWLTKKSNRRTFLGKNPCNQQASEKYL